MIVKILCNLSLTWNVEFYYSYMVQKEGTKFTFSEPYIKQAIWEIRFTPILAFHKKRIDICEKFVDKLPHWGLDMRKIEMYDQLEKESSDRKFTLTNRGASFIFKNVGHYDNFKSPSIYFLENITRDLDIKKISRFGVRLFFITKYTKEFNQLKNLISKKIYNEQFLKNLNQEKKISDVGTAIDFNLKAYKYHLVFGPATKKEIEKSYGKNGSEDVKVALLCDIDCYLENATPAIIKNMMKDSYENSKTTVKDIIKYINEE